MNRNQTRAIALAGGLAGLLVVACSVSGGTVAGGSPGASTAILVTASPAASLEPGPSPQLEPSLELPPAAYLAVEGGDPVEGQLGSFGWRNAGSDSPWLPGAPIRVAGGERLTLTLAEPVALDSWTVSRSPSDQPGDALVGLGEGTNATVSFPAPPPGSWSVGINLWFADQLGSAAYYWRIEVD